MEKVDLTKQFSYRLKEAMLAAGLNSSRSITGVAVHKLAEITGYSIQICRRYLRGEAIPEATKLVEIAEKLAVSPGWLLFGAQHNTRQVAAEEIIINKNLLSYIFFKASKLYTHSRKLEEVPNFLVELVADISQINASEEQLKKIIDLALSSANHFNES